MRAIRRFSVRTVLPEPIAALGDLASNLRWSWHAPTRELFADLDPQRWQAVRHDPVALLGDLAPERLAELADDPTFVAKVEAAAADLAEYVEQPRWFQTQGQSDVGGEGLPRSIAYFSAEFGITAVLPQYSGGLGILAGDHLKAASDLGVPIVGVGLFYKTGYFKQSLSREGWQQETYPVLDPDGLPLSLLREDDGTPCQIVVDLPGGRRLVAHVWKAQVGRVPLLLLDSDTQANDEALRGVTDRLYGGSGEHRLQQEMLLG
ncbi:MAG: alpha-glucan family phosphorylase, partial [Nocardioides sp.]